jgi:hypothetical protein
MSVVLCTVREQESMQFGDYKTFATRAKTARGVHRKLPIDEWLHKNNNINNNINNYNRSNTKTTTTTNSSS